MKNSKNKIGIFSLVLLALGMVPSLVFAQEEQATMKINFTVVDSVNVCKAIITAKDKPVKDVSVTFYVKRLFSLLPIGKAATTNEEGVAKVTFPKNLPGGETGMLVVYAKVDDDPVVGKLEVKDSVKWGKVVPKIDEAFGDRSLSASREKAPYILIIASNLIIGGIWITLFYVAFQLFVRIKKSARKTVGK